MKLLEDDEQYRKDSADQSRITRLNLETFQRLQDKGYSYDRAIHYLDSMNHKIYNGNFPQWYNEWKERIDTTLKYH